MREPPEDCGYDKVYDIVVNTGHLGLQQSWIEFMLDNCEGKWGWHWGSASNISTCQVSFEKPKDATWFALNYNFSKEDKLKE